MARAIPTTTGFSGVRKPMCFLFDEQWMRECEMATTLATAKSTVFEGTAEFSDFFFKYNNNVYTL